ncbi:MAG: helix-turn-helix transcriptional regulator [Actinomycetota bacterium]
MRDDLEQRWAELGEFIRDRRTQAELSLRRLSELSGISNPYLSQIERGLRRPSAEILQQLATALSISAESLYVQAGMLEPRDGEHDVVTAIRSDARLTDDQKQSLLTIYRSFVADPDEDLPG